MIPHQTAPVDAPPVDVDLDLVADPEQLLADIEQYLAASAPAPGPATAHPLVSLTTEELVAQALGTVAVPAGPEITGPARWTRALPSWVLRLTGAAAGTRPVTARQHLELTALLLERYGWTGGGTTRTVGGRRCIAGAQAALVHLGYGDWDTAREAGELLDQALTARGAAGPYYEWNDRPGRTADEALALVRAAAQAVTR